MKKKLKVSIIGIVFILVGGLLALNWYFGQVISQEIESEIANQIEVDDDIEDINYDNLAVNPLLSRMKFDQLSIVEKEAKLDLSDIELKFGLTDIINIAQQDDLSTFPTEEINYLRLKFNSFNFEDESGIELAMEDFAFEGEGYYKDDILQDLNKFDLELASLAYNLKGDEEISINDLEIFFNGYITDEMFELEEDFLAYDQNLDFSLAEADVSAGNYFEKLLFKAETANKLFNIDKLDFKLAHDAADNILKIEDTKIKTPIVESESDYRYYLNEDYQFDDPYGEEPLLLKAEGKGDLQMEAEDLVWGDPNITGRYSIDKIEVDNEFDTEMRYDDLITILTSPSQLEAEFLLEGFKVDFAGELREEIKNNPLLFMFGFGIDDFRIDYWSIEAKENLEEVLANSEFKSPLLNTDFNFALEIDDEEAEMSEVKDLEIRFSDLHSNLEMLLLEMSQPLGISLTQDGEDIVFSRKGYLGEIIDNFAGEDY